MIAIQFNNEIMEVAPKTSLALFLEKRGITGSHFAVAINRTFVSRHHYADIFLKEKDVIEIIAPMQGG